MPIRFSKRLSLGKGFHINLSKSGIGFSQKIGNITLGSRRNTINIPGTGVSLYQNVKISGKSRSQSNLAIGLPGISDPTLLPNGIAALRAGNRDEARQLLQQAAQQEPDNESAWKWLCNAVDTDQERIPYLQEILRINPKNEKAAQYYKKITGAEYKAPVEPISNLHKFLIGILSIVIICILCSFIFLFSPDNNIVSTPTPETSTYATQPVPARQVPIIPPVNSGHPAGTSGRCNDGTYSKAAHRQGACSRHNGLAEWWGP